MKKLHETHLGLFLLTFCLSQLIFIWNVDGQTPIKKSNSSISNSTVYATTICPVKDNRKAILSITMDDGYPNSDAYYERQFIANDLRATPVLISNWMNYSSSTAPSYKEYYQQLLTRGRFEYGSHSKSHPTTEPSTTTASISEIATSRSELLAMFPTQNVITFTLYNGVTFTGDNLSLAKSTYSAMRSGTRGYNSLLPTETDMYALKVQGVLNSETAASMNTWVDNALLSKQWLIEMWHAIYEYDPATYNPPSESITTPHLQYIGDKQKAGLLWVATFGEAVQYIKERGAATITDDASTTTRIITLTDTLKNNLFNYPLTLKSEVPSSWTSVQVKQGENIQQITTVKESTKYYVYYNVVPDMGNIVLTNGSAPGSDITTLSISNGLFGTDKSIVFTASTLPSSGTNDGTIEWFVNGVKQFALGRTFSFVPTLAGYYGVVAKSVSPTTLLPVYSNIVTFSVTQGQTALQNISYSDIKIYRKDKSIYILNSSMENIRSIVVCNLKGQVLFKNDDIQNTSYIFNNLNFGFYIIKVTTDKESITQKVLVC